MNEILSTLLKLMETHPRLVLTTIVEHKGSVPRAAGSRMIVLPDGTARGTIGGGKFEDLVRQDALRLLQSGHQSLLRDYSFVPDGPDTFGAVCGGVVKVFLEVIGRSRPLLVVGAGHCGRALARIAALTGYSVTVVDDRAEFLEKAAFPDEVILRLVKSDFSDLPEPTPDTAVAVISRGHVSDGVALRALKGVPLFYLGMMGSKAKRVALFADLTDEGFTAGDMARIHTPIGLPIGAETPEEIAISILAEIISLERGAAAT